MKLYVRLVILIVTLIVLLPLAGYGFLQTRYGIALLTGWINTDRPYSVTFNRISYHLSRPATLSLHQLRLDTAQQSEILTADQADIQFSFAQLTDFWHVSSVTLQHGIWRLADAMPSLPIYTNVLRLQNITFSGQSAANNHWQLSGVKGHIRLSAATGRLDFNLAATDFALYDIRSDQIQLQGQIENGTLNLSDIKARLYRGTLHGSLQRHPDGSWLVRQLDLAHLRLQTDKTPQQIAAYLTQLPPIVVQRLTVNDARLEGIAWAASDVNLQLTDLKLDQQHWYSDQGMFNLNASDLIYKSVHLIQPMINARFSAQGIRFEKLASQWQKSQIQTSGQWLRASKTLALETLNISHLEYTLPENWQTFWRKPLPDWLENIRLDNLSASQNLIINIHPDFPFQLTDLSVSGQQLQLVKQRHHHFWLGDIQLKTRQSTFNGVELYQSTLTLHASPQQLSSQLHTKMSAGELTASASVCQCDARFFNLRLQGQSSPRWLTQWGWPEPVMPTATNIQLEMQGRLAGYGILAASVDAHLQLTGTDGAITHQMLKSGQPVPYAKTGTKPHTAKEK